MTAELRNIGWRRTALAAVLTLVLPLAVAGGASAAAGLAGPAAAEYVPGRLIVGYTPPVRSVVADIRADTGLGVDAASEPASLPGEQVVSLPRGHTVMAAAAQVRRAAGVTFAVPDYVAHAAGDWYPDDPGRIHRPRGWEQLQWNFMPAAGVNAPEAWANLIADHDAGARGVRVAILDTGVAYRRWHKFRESPDFRGTRFVAPCDLVAGRIRHGRCTDPYALDRDGHGTFVAGMVAEATNNGVAVTGLAYHASIMPVRVLNAGGYGDSSTVAAGIRYAVKHRAQVINLSLEFGVGVSAADIPSVVSALNYANAHRVIVVAAAGNDSADRVAYPARYKTVIAVGATTSDRCLAEYSNRGAGLNLVAPGGGNDADDLDDPDCHPNRNLPSVYQMTFRRVGHPGSFGLPGGWFGTSMAAPEVSAAAAMVIASRVIGRHPTPAAVLRRLEQTAEPLGGSVPNFDYGYGLLDIGAATAPPPAT